MANPPDATRMRLRMRVHEVSHTARLRRVLTTASPLRHTHLSNLLWQPSGALIGSRADLLRLGALFRLAAVSSHSAIYLPLRANKPHDYLAGRGDGRGMDLIVVRRDVPLRPSAWPAIRTRLRHGPRVGVPATVVTPAPRPAVPGNQEWDWAKHSISVAEHAGTVFLSGTARALHEHGDELTWCGNQVVVNPHIHRYGGDAFLSQVSGPDSQPGRRDATWECVIIAEDHIFHRARWARIRSTSTAPR